MAATLDQSMTTVDSGLNLRFNSNYEIFAQQFKPAFSGEIPQIILEIKKNNTPTGNAWVEIWSDNGSDAPSTQIGNDSSLLDVSTLTTTPTDITFTFSTNKPTITANTLYWIVIYADYALSTSNNIRPSRYTASDQYVNGVNRRWNGTSWVYAEDANDDFYFKQYYTPIAGGSKRLLVGHGV